MQPTHVFVEKVFFYRYVDVNFFEYNTLVLITDTPRTELEISTYWSCLQIKYLSIAGLNVDEL